MVIHYWADNKVRYISNTHLPEFGLINMNGRLYDPLLGRMLSPDNYVQDAMGNPFNVYLRGDSFSRYGLIFSPIFNK